MTYTQARRQRQRADVIADTIKHVATMVAFVCVSAIIALVLVNWLTGCGETFITYTGERIQGECVFMPWRDKYATKQENTSALLERAISAALKLA